MMTKNRQKAQTAIELAVFGAILIFILGIIVRSALGRGLQQHAVLMATRKAMTTSYDYSSSMWNASRNSASVLVVEDRLTAVSAKYGAVDRIPLMMQGSGTHSANLFMPVDFGDSGDLPVMDLFVNGRHFVFSTVAFRSYSTADMEREPNCHASGGCPRLYTIIDHHPMMDRWCDDEGLPCPTACSDTITPGCNLSADERFDLDRNDRDGIPGDITVPAGQRARFSWQWYLVMGFDEESGAGGLRMAEGINVGAGKNVNLDVDGDLKLERVDSVSSGPNGIITGINVRDYQEGDIDLTFNDSDPGLRPGFTEDVRMYTFVHGAGPAGGTYLQIDEGNLYAGVGDNRQFIRTASKKDSIDIIERVFQLSNNTGRLCRGGTVVAYVEACGTYAGACFTSENIERTCLDVPNLLLFIRSRIADVHGRKWVTEVSSDPAIDFMGQ